MKSFLAGAALVSVLGSAAVAQQGGYVNTNVNLRAGPGTTYPVVTILQTGTPLEIFGCLDEYTWCDVDWRGYRGWVAAQYLDYEYRGRRVEFYDYAPRMGVPIVTFNFDNYWGRYYRGRSWYTTNDRWGPPPPRRYPPPPPGGPGWGPPPPGGPGWGGPPPPGGPGWGGPPPGGPGWGPPPGNGWGNQGRPPQGNWNGNNRPPPQQGGRPPQQGGPGGPPPQQGGPPPQRPQTQPSPPQQAQPSGDGPRGPRPPGNDCAVPTMVGCRSNN